MGKIIRTDRSLVPACDVSLELYERIVRETADVAGVGAYKVGFQLGLAHGLPRIVELARQYTDKPIIYDHQKAATDIPDTGVNFAETLSASGVDAVIFFPQAGPATEEAWIAAAKDAGLGVIVGGWMTHERYLKSEGGFLDDASVLEMFALAARQGVTDFVVPGNKPEAIMKIRKTIEKQGVKPVLYAPGFIAQGGKITDAAEAAGKSWHAIVGRGIYKAENIREAALKYAQML